MNKLLRVDFKLCRKDISSILLLIISFTIGMFITLFLVNVSINGFVRIDHISNEKDALEIVSVGKDELSDDLLTARSKIFATEQYAVINEINVPIYLLEGDYIEGNGFILTPFFIRELGGCSSLNYLGEQQMFSTIELPFPELFPFIFYIGDEINNGTYVGEIAQFKSNSVLCNYVNNFSGGNNNYTKADDIRGKNQVLSMLFAVITIAGCIGFVSFYCTYYVKVRLINKRAYYSYSLRRVLGFNNLQSKSGIILRYCIVLSIGTLIGYALLYGVMSILSGISIPIFMMDFAEFMSVRWYTPLCYLVPYIALSTIDIFKNNKNYIGGIDNA